MSFRNVTASLLILLVFITFACTQKAAKPQATMDTPEHHVMSGNKLLKAGNYDGAITEFERAKALDPKYAPAYLGLGLGFSYKGDYATGLKQIKKASGYTKGDSQKYDVEIGYMRVYLMGKQQADRDWFDELRSNYRKASSRLPEQPDAFYYMGLAYKTKYEFRKASREFAKVLDLDKGLVEEADREYALMQKIERAMPGSTIGKQIAIQDSITRADLAALFIHELQIDDLYKRRAKRTFDTSYKAPGKTFKAGEYVKAPPATDIETHVLKADIDAVIAIGIKGLQPFPDHTFKPDKPTTRAEFAMIVEDIMITITRDAGLATMFIGNQSPFPDLRNDLPYFNAVMVCTTRGIINAKDAGSGEFDAAGSIPGADALLSIRTLKAQLAKY
ncbi:MAG: tetratricopeptide repeat protein [Desulfobacterales bacterium]|nr:tetratricopeptide repeat protein [Desulfobacterales bacterium]